MIPRLGLILPILVLFAALAPVAMEIFAEKRRIPRVVLNVLLVAFLGLIAWGEMQAAREAGIREDAAVDSRVKTERDLDVVRDELGVVRIELSNIRSEAYSLGSQLNKNDMLHVRELQGLREKLEPFLEIARGKYPGLPDIEALRRLQQQIDNVGVLATRDIYRPLSSAIRAEVVASLKSIRASAGMPLTLNIDTDSSAPKRLHRLANQIAELARSAGWASTAYSSAILSFPSPGTMPISISSAPDSAGVANRLNKSLLRFIDTRSNLVERPSLPSGVIHLGIRGEASFLPNGTAHME